MTWFVRLRGRLYKKTRSPQQLETYEGNLPKLADGFNAHLLHKHGIDFNETTTLREVRPELSVHQLPSLNMNSTYGLHFLREACLQEAMAKMKLLIGQKLADPEAGIQAML